MKKLLPVLAVLIFSSCSFDNKTGIWKDASDISVDNKQSKSISKNLPGIIYENVSTKNIIYNEEKDAVNLSNFEIDNPIKISNWLEQFAIPTNNISNISYSGNKRLLYKSSKLSSVSSSKNRNIIFYDNNLISHDQKGTIFIFSLSLNKKIFEFNFYKKNFENINKELNFIVNDNFLYVSDNLGYLYAINLDNKSIIWAKNYGIPFRSNLKFINNEIFLANQDNVIYAINANTGEKNWQFQTSLTFLKSDFVNNFALDLINSNLIFLNTSGELYSINFESQKINWVLNFKNSSLAGDTELFLSHPIVIKNNNLTISTEKFLLNYDTETASRNWMFSSESIFKPIITSNYIYVILKNDLLVCLENASGKVIWSKNIFTNLKDKKIQNKFGLISDFKIVNSEIYIYSKNGYLLTFNPSNGALSFFNEISKNGISSEIVFLDNNMLFLDNDNKLLKFN